MPRTRDDADRPEDDVEGHSASGRFLAPSEDPDDVDGHIAKFGLTRDADDDVEGHSASGRFLAPSEDPDDVDGHYRKPGVAPDADEDDVQGHMIPGKTIPRVMPDDELSDHLPR